MNRLLIIVVLGVFAISCNKDEDLPETSNDYLVFGHFYGMCGGEACVEIFKLEDERLYEDVKDDYPDWMQSYEGDFVLLSDTSYQKVSDLPDYFPEELWNSMDTVFGIPDGYDQGGLYIERMTDDQHRFWIMDQDKDSIPAYAQDFHDEVNAAIGRINE